VANPEQPAAPVGLDVVAELVAIEEIRQLKARYFRLMDTKEWEQWGDVFTADARLQYGPADTDVVTGRDAIVAHVSAVLATATTVHQGAMPEIEIIDATRAHGIWAMFDYTESPHGYTDRLDPGQAESPVATDLTTGPATGSATGRAKKGWGHYVEDYAKDADGRWRIRSCQLTRLRVDRF
jgi:hypothetical protein